MWRNWSREQACAPVALVAPASVAEAAEAIAHAARAKLHVRVAGAGHSFTDAVCTPDMLMRLDRMDEVLEIDRKRGQVRVQGGCRLGRLSDRLGERGMALRNLGDIDRQTIAGALATATHGTGTRLQTLAEDVVELQLLDAEGRLHTLARGEHEEAFRAAQVAVGVLGVITSVTLRCEPAFRLRTIERPQAVDELLAQLPRLAPAHDHFEAFIFPYADECVARYADRTDEPATRRTRARAWLDDILVGNHLFQGLLATGRAIPPLVPTLNRVAVASASPTDRVQDSHAALASTRLMRFVEMEWMLPVDAAAQAVRTVRELVRRHRLSVNMPIELRFVAADGAFLSPTYGRPSCCIAVHAYRGMPWQPYFRAVERAMWELDGRPHWGKLHFQTFQTLSPRYPAWDRFQEVRARFDPQGRFRNAYTDRVLGLPPPARGRA